MMKPQRDMNTNDPEAGDSINPNATGGDNSDRPEAWLPITESRNGNIWFCIFHLVCSGLGVQALTLPVAFATLGWAWGVTYMTLGFVWQLYTKWLLIHLHESTSGVRNSRYIQLATVAFGPRLGKWLCLFPLMYLSGGQDVMIVITGGSTLKFLQELICSNGSYCGTKSLSIIEWYLIFVCVAFVIAQVHPNLNSLSWVSLFGTVASILYCSLLWIMPLVNGKVAATSYNPILDEDMTTRLAKFLSSLSAMELIAFSFRGHNLILEIQGTLPSSVKHPSHKIMWKAVKITYVLISLCLFPLAIGGYWAYGDKVIAKGIAYTFEKFHKDNGSRTALSLALFFISIHQLCSYQVYAMPTLDNFELSYIMLRKKRCSFWVRGVLRLIFGAICIFLAVTFPFIPTLTPLTGGITMTVTFAYPCFMWIAIKKPRPWETMHLLNWGLGCLGLLMSALFFITALWNLARKGLTANFFHPQ